MPEVVIAKLNVSDLDAVMSIVQDAIVSMEAQGIFQWDEVYPTREIIQDDLSEEEPLGMYGLFAEKKLLGFVVLNEVQHAMYETISWKYTSPLVIHRLTIHPSVQGKRYASTLVKFSENVALRNRYRSLRLDAFIPNKAAVRLYESNGFEKRGVIHFRKGEFYAMEKQMQ